MRNRKGFSFMEVLIVVSIMGILATLGFYGYKRLMIKNRVETDTRKILAVTNRARQYSFTRKVPLKLNLNGRSLSITDGSGDIYADFSLELADEFLLTGDISFRDGFSTVGMIRTRRNLTGAEYDCVLFETGRIRAGAYDGVKCNVR